jgi:hypothetical protein
MKHAILIMVSTALMMTGCSHAIRIRSVDSDEFRAFNERASRSSSTVILDDGTEHEALTIILREDTTTWFNKETSVTANIPTKRIRTITFVSHADGFLEGAAIGFLAVGGLAGIWGWSQGSDKCSGTEICLTRGNTAALAIIIVGVPGALLGGIAGAGHGTIYIYYPFPEESTKEKFEHWKPF